MTHPVLRAGGYVVVPESAAWSIARVPVSAVRLPDNHCAMDLEHVRCLTAALGTADVEPITLAPVADGSGTYWLISGRHRYVAALVLGRDEILAVVAEVEIRNAPTDQD